MRAITSVLCLAASLAVGDAGPVLGQAMPMNAAGITMGHWHLNSKDIATNKKLFETLGGKPIKPGDFEIVLFPGVAVFQHLRPGLPPPTAGTVGSVINHVGFAVPNLAEAMARWKAAGLAVEAGKDQAFITTTDGLRIEFLEDKAQSAPIRHNRVSYHVPKTVIPEIQAWYGKHFGAKAGTQGGLPTAELPGASLVFIATEEPKKPTRGRVLDHIGFDVKDMLGLVKKLEAGGVKLAQPLVARPDGNKLTFVNDPWGASIELNERPIPFK